MAKHILASKLQSIQFNSNYANDFLSIRRCLEKDSVLDMKNCDEL